MNKALPLLILTLAFASPARAVLPGEQLSNPVLEARARAISQELRCVVCQNQTIDDSDATLAHDLRVIVRERLVKGDTDEQVKAYIVHRYGPYVLLKPPFEPVTLFLWLGPLFVLLAGAAGAWIHLQRRSERGDTNLTSEEEQKLAGILTPDHR
ncbi:MAG TPA: cytochrome c-type biogenesis protein [Rhizomicrobium sp.]